MLYFVSIVDIPTPPENCTLQNSTLTLLKIECKKMRLINQTYHLEAYNVDTHLQTLNSTNSTPIFYIHNVSTLQSLIFYVYSKNKQGKSEPTSIQAPALRTSEIKSSM